MSTAIHSAGMANKGPQVPYRSVPGSSTLRPTGNSYGKQWGELTRQNKPGKDIWGGKENPGLNFKGKTAQRSDYWHQMAEQPKVTAPKTPRVRPGGGLSIPNEKVYKPIGSGASAWMGGSSGGGGGGMGRK
jgi:hypothetical protein